MQFIPLQNFENITAKKIFQAYTTTFPPEERRNETQFLGLFSNPKVSVKSIQNQGLEIGYLVLWHLSDFVFLEHFEVFSEYRNQKWGAQILEQLKDAYPHLILESEPPSVNDIAQRRIDFYQRNGFFIIDQHYTQPSYGEGKEAINLYLLANFAPKKNDELQKEIHQVVYGVQ